ncbi:hypothetical protein L209DRAFT_802856, partial [Thermothelomyces heterothallicus CBS 203.75]
KETESKTYNTEDSPVVTDLSTSSAVSSLSMGERTGSRIFYCLWSYVLGTWARAPFIGLGGVLDIVSLHVGLVGAAPFSLGWRVMGFSQVFFFFFFFAP